MSVRKKAQRRSIDLIHLRLRRRDFIVLGLLVGAVLSILLMTGVIGFVEGVTSYIVFISASLAYFISTGETSARVETIKDASPNAENSADRSRAVSATEQGTLKELIGRLPGPVLLINHENRILAANPGAIALFHLPEPVKPIGVSQLRRRDLLSATERVFKTGAEQKLEIRISGEQDEVYLCRLSQLALGDHKHVLAVFEDQTALKRAEQARADFLANASHELRTPLTSLAGFIETMRGPAQDDPESWDRFLEIMYAQTERMRRLIHDLLSLSRIELSEHTRPDAEVNLAQVISEVNEALVPVAENRSIQISASMDKNNIPVIGFRDELSQVVQNLIDNAIKYSPSGSTVTVQVTCDCTIDQARQVAGRKWADAARMSIASAIEDPHGKFTAIRVSDQGEGIAREHLPRLGERFYRIDKGRDRKIGGTGLGLAIVKHIATRHRGGFMVETLPGKGSAFGIVLPQPEAAPRDEPVAVETAE